jgi:hypothetical protein
MRRSSHLEILRYAQDDGARAVSTARERRYNPPHFRGGEMRQRLLRVIGCVAVLLTALRGHDASAETGSGEVFVPWKVLNPGDAPLTTSLVLYWIPGSRDEIRHSGLLISRPLATYSTQCVGMQLIRPDDDAMIEKLEATGKLPLCVLVQSDGTTIARVGGGRNGLRLADVEKMVRDQLESRETSIDTMLDGARQKLDRGDRSAAIELYRQVAAEQCLFPRQAHDAQKALRKLGVEAAAK